MPFHPFSVARFFRCCCHTAPALHSVRCTSSKRCSSRCWSTPALALRPAAVGNCVDLCVRQSVGGGNNGGFSPSPLTCLPRSSTHVFSPPVSPDLKRPRQVLQVQSVVRWGCGLEITAVPYSLHINRKYSHSTQTQEKGRENPHLMQKFRANL